MSLQLVKKLKSFSAWWGRQRRFFRNLSLNLLVGVVISIMIWSFHDNAWLQDLEDSGIDWVMSMQWGVGEGRDALPFVLLDIDERTYRAWGEPFYIPRDHLLKLIDHAVQSQAALIIVDVELSKVGHDQSADASLESYLRNYADRGKPPLILTRFFRQPLNSRQEIYPSERQSFLNNTVAESPLVHWGSSLFMLDRDHLLRRWRLWEPFCNDEQPGVLPSIQLLSIVLLRDHAQSPSLAVTSLHKALTSVKPKECSALQDQTLKGKTLKIAGLELSAEPTGLAQRILYTLPRRLKPGQAYPILDDGTPVLAIRSALPITAGHQAVATEEFAGRIVVIGASFNDSRDNYFTPLDYMPGALILINAIQSLYQNGELQPPPWYVKLLIQVVLIILMSVIFSLMSSFWGMAISSAVVILLLLPLSFIYFRTGVWLDFAIPLMAVQLHQIAAEFKELKKKSVAEH